MARLDALLVAVAIAATACSFVYDTSDLRGGGGGDGGAAGSTTSSNGGGGGIGGDGGAACACEMRTDIVWLLRVDDASPSAPPTPCPRGRNMAAGALAGSLQDDASQCGGSCVGPSRVKVAVDDSCGVLGEGIDNSGACDAKTLVPETPGDTSLAINLEPLPCSLADPALTDMASVTLATACSVGDDDCAPPVGARRCIPATKSGCSDPCFGEPAAVATIVDDRSCDGVLATCSPAVFGELELHDDGACTGGPIGSWSVRGSAICPATPTPPVSPSTSYWRFSPDPQSCEAAGQPNGAIMLGETLVELCCAPASG